MKREDLIAVRCKVMLSVVKRDEGILFCPKRRGGFSLILAGCFKSAEGGMTLVLEVERLTVGRDSREREDDGEMGGVQIWLLWFGKRSWK